MRNSHCFDHNHRLKGEWIDNLCVNDLSKYCLRERGAGSSKRWFPHFKYRAVMAVGVGILYNSGDFSI